MEGWNQTVPFPPLLTKRKDIPSFLGTCFAGSPEEIIDEDTEGTVDYSEDKILHSRAY